ncbi:MarP family serine protease [Pseudonocardia benzenivorans]|uniref:Colicin V production protein n=1 Tax=Pseudonocardia dioxanivorans (strain ATCC 55486 / DSM 44775 / JCM 13855 / CB1190) TaxID=675635 RepID=F4CV55_PSEUX|nr:Colicin V production protein [Pseudonocardia dioxanivorans CB1190]GJF03578.1 serine protease [Pseudonocardia sp. D17]
MSISWVDIVVVLLAIVAGVSGWRHGMAVAFLSFVGVLGGAILGVRLAPLIVSGITSQHTRVIVSIVVVVLLVALGETTGVFFGRRIRDRITGERTLKVDSALGSLLQAFTVVVAAWLVALPLASASFPGLAASVRSSEVLQSVDSVMPSGARKLPAELRQLLDDSGFPDVLSPFAPTPITAVGPPDSALARSQVVRDVAGSVLKVRGRAPSCQRQLEGTGFVVGPQRVMTNAHVVAGTNQTSVEVPSRGGRTRTLAATVVYYDPEVDVAILSVPDLDADPLTFTPDAGRAGDDAIVLGYPLDGPYTATAAKVRDRIQLRGPDIYDNGTVTRDVYTIRAVVRSGNSGGPMITPGGQVLGVVFGAALDDSETGFVLTADQVSAALNAADNLTRRADTGTCAA